MTEHTHNYEADHHPEIVENGKAVRRLELLGLDETLADAASRRQFFGSLSDESYQKLFGYINSVTQGEAITYAYTDGQLPMEGTPPLEDKEQLMNLTFATVRSVLRDERRSDEDALQLAGLTFAGAINYIHPRENGNGRSGRVSHYLMSYGTERGQEAFEAELYGAIAKLPAYDIDPRATIYDTPPPELGKALMKHLYDNDPTMAQLDDRRQASKRVELYLQVMRGEVSLPLPEDVTIVRREGLGIVREVVPKGTEAAVLYREDYRRRSYVPNHEPSELPAEAKRVLAEPKPASGTITLELDLL